MTRAELMARLAQKNPQLLRKNIEKAVSITFESIATALAHDQRVELRGFGAFFTKSRRAKMGRNPRTGENIPVAAKKVPCFRAGKPLQKKMNENA